MSLTPHQLKRRLRYQEQREREIASTKERRARNRYLMNLHKDVPCADCGDRFPPICMDFDHHQGGKTAGVASLNTASVERLLAEIAACEVVCANCHRLRTHARGTSGATHPKETTA